MRIEHHVKNITLTNLTKWLNDTEQFEKQTKTKFTTNDVNQYIQLGHLPYYMSGNVIEESEVKVEGIKLYNLRK